MTYNFDPDKWLDDQFFMLQVRQKNGELSQAQFDMAVLDLEEKHEAMWQRLDNSYCIVPEQVMNRTGHS